jgi:transcription initiation factor TFIIIB Brf1 subunit/transcription initiation factor TFIIB
MQSIPVKNAAVGCCAAPHLVTSNGAITCASCGAVVDTCFVQDGFTLGDNETYTATKAKQHVALGQELSSKMKCGAFIDFFTSTRFHDSNHVPLKPEKQKLFYRLKFNRDFRGRITGNETRMRTMQVLKDVAGYLGIVPSIKERAAYMYQRVLKQSNSKIISHVSLIASCLVMATKENQAIAPVTVNEVCDAFQTFHHRVRPSLVIRDILRYRHVSSAKMKGTNVATYITRQLSMLANDQAFQDYYALKVKYVPVETYIAWMYRSVANIVKVVPSDLRLTRNPYTMTAALVYLIDQLNAKLSGSKHVLTQRILAGAVDCAEYTIRDVYCQVKANLTKEMRDVFSPIVLPKHVVKHPKKKVRKKAEPIPPGPVTIKTPPIVVVAPPVIAMPPTPAAQPPIPLSNRKMICKVCGEVVSKTRGCKRCIVENPEKAQLPLPFNENALFRMAGQRA